MATMTTTKDDESTVGYPTYKYMEGVTTLRDIPHKIDDGQDPSSLSSQPSMAIVVPNEDMKTNPGIDISISYTQLQSMIEQVAIAFTASTNNNNNNNSFQLAKGDIVSNVIPNSVEFIVSFYATTWCRGVSAPLNSTYTQSEFEFYMKDNQSKCVLVPPSGNPAAEEAAKTLGIPVFVIEFDSTTMSMTVLEKGKAAATAESALKETEPVTKKSKPNDEDNNTDQSPTFAPEPDDVALFLHTSGTTARPKGVPLTHGNLIASINNISTTYQLTPADNVLLVMPLFHIHGLMSALNSTLATGGTVVLPPQTKFSASYFWHNAVQGNVTWVTAVPTIYQVLLLRYDKDYPKGSSNEPKFRFVRSCSSALAPAILSEIEAKFKAPCVEAYAMTEASHQMTSNPIESDQPRKPGTVGKGTGVSVAVLDSNNNVITQPNTEGEVCIRGKNVTKGYIGVSPEVNDEAFAGGWFHTGDQGKLDEDGYLQLTGRIKELINRGGEKISPLEVDAAMLSHPAVAEAVSFSMPDDKYGELVAAAIVLKESDGDAESNTLDEQGLQEFLKDKLSVFKIPVKVFFDTKLPKTPTGKIQRRFVAAHFLKT